jgi:hypothetical protein
LEVSQQKDQTEALASPENKQRRVLVFRVPELPMVLLPNIAERYVPNLLFGNRAQSFPQLFLAIEPCPEGVR